LYSVQKLLLCGSWSNQEGRQCRVEVSLKLVRIRRSCWKRLSSGSESTIAWVKFAGIVGVLREVEVVLGDAETMLVGVA
jgi:hypothetical protein